MRRDPCCLPSVNMRLQRMILRMCCARPIVPVLGPRERRRIAQLYPQLILIFNIPGWVLRDDCHYTKASQKAELVADGGHRARLA